MELRRIAARIAADNGGLVPNPFPNSKMGEPVFHGAESKGIRRFNRPTSGVWFARSEGWVDGLYTGKDGTGEVITCWIDVRNPYVPTDEEADTYYSYEGMRKGVEDGFWDRLRREGYDAYDQGGESGSIAVFESVKIVDASTGAEM